MFKYLLTFSGRILACRNDCYPRTPLSSKRSHYHCPFCKSIYIRKEYLIQHLRKVKGCLFMVLNVFLGLIFAFSPALTLHLLFLLLQMESVHIVSHIYFTLIVILQFQYPKRPRGIIIEITFNNIIILIKQQDYVPK